MNLYEQCEDLFARYPLAVEVYTRRGTQSLMILMAAGRKPQFFCVRHVSDGQPLPFFSVRPWGSGDGVVVQSDGAVMKERDLDPAEAGRLTRAAIPLPRDGRLFGWVQGGTVTALIPFYSYAGNTRDDVKPGFSVLPLAGTAPETWPPFTGEPAFGSYFWDHYNAGRLVDVSPHVAATKRVAWWVDTKAALGWHSCAVAQPQALPGHVMLPAGLYVYYQILRDGTALPSLADVLASKGKTDLGPRFADAA